MKLRIQYLQKSIESGNENVKEMTQKVSQTLVEQIDHLSTIASDFSQFANIANTKLEELDIVPLLQSLQLLFSNENGVEISIQIHATFTKITADKTQINRLFTNLIKNGIQAYSENAFKKIALQITNTETNLLVAVQDFANGIPVALQNKIFTPNFTTKTSGTGLGLAIAKGIVEQSKGRIWFTTQEGIGTSFFVELPLVI
jgi:two-component system, NtrC family, nitrogen regulation sensor histidine kinase NtrY